MRFKNEIGFSPVDFINTERIKRDTSLLQDPSRNLKNVYMECGFESRSYFSPVFKKLKNVSSSRFQERSKPVN